MSRLWQSGFENNTLASNAELDAVSTTAPVIQTTTVRSGTYALQVTNVSGTAKYVNHQFISASGTGPWWFRFYINIGTTPNATTQIFQIDGGTTSISATGLGLKLTTTRTLQVVNSNTQVGADSAALNTGQWYRIEVFWDGTGGTGLDKVTAYVDGVAFVTSTTLTFTTTTVKSVWWGGNITTNASTDSAGILYFDDLAINNNAGTVQNALPGSGKIVHARPNAAGDSTGWTKGGTTPAATNWQSVSEVVKDDGVTTVGANTAVTDHYKISAPAEIGATDTITFVAIGFRGTGGAVNNNSTFKLEIESQASGTKLQSAAIAPSTNSFFTEASSAPRNYQLYSFTDPQAGGAWTQSLINTAQIGQVITVAATNQAIITQLWASIEFITSTDFNVSVSDSSTTAESVSTTNVLGISVDPTNLAYGIPNLYVVIN